MVNTTEMSSSVTTTGPRTKSQAFSSLVRPLSTGMFGIAQIGLAIAWTMGMAGAEPAFAALSPFTMMIITFWFKSRSDE